MQKEVMTGAEIIVACLREQGVDRVFGYPGASILGVYDAISRAGGAIRHCRTSHEQGAAHAADGYARATGRVGVCLATSGPGATNLVTGIAAAYMDSSPIVCITCNVKSSLIARDAFQEADITGITAPITKHNYLVSDVSRLADTIREAFYIARSGRCGPVLVDICQDVTEASFEYHYKEPRSLPLTASADGDIDYAMELIARSRRPLILAGGGVVASGAKDRVLALSARLGAPVAATLMGLGAGFSGFERFYGMTGVYGVRGARAAVSKSDLIIAAGTRFSDRQTERLSGRERIIHIDIDRAELNKNIDALALIEGDAGYAIDEILKGLGDGGREPWCPPPPPPQRCLRYSPESIIPLIPESAIVTTDVGMHQMQTARGLRITRSRAFITSGGFGAMGFGLGAAIGAAFGCPGTRIINITGDGGFRMNLIELATVREHDLPITTIVMANHELGMIASAQDEAYGGRRFASDLSTPVDYAKVAEAYGITAYNAGNIKEFARVLDLTMSAHGPAVIICKFRKRGISE